jgi:hypothetical protein
MGGGEKMRGWREEGEGGGGLSTIMWPHATLKSFR